MAREKKKKRRKKEPEQATVFPPTGVRKDLDKKRRRDPKWDEAEAKMNWRAKEALEEWKKKRKKKGKTKATNTNANSTERKNPPIRTESQVIGVLLSQNAELLSENAALKQRVKKLKSSLDQVRKIIDKS